jgi:malonate-semialdehyde dehydrogenase (acetylating)/methylmalonate-semialdehyde dehydrogenase
LSLLCTTATALALGNCIILNPPSHCAASAARIVDLSVEAGMPSGVLQVVHGDASIFNGLSEHPDIAAVIFAGASVPAEAVYKRCTAANKRVVAFGGAKNHVFALPECHVTATARDVTTAFTAHAGQRRLAASVLVLVGDGSEQVKRAFLDTLVPEIVSLAGKLEAGQKPGQMGPLADAAARDRYVYHVVPTSNFFPCRMSHHFYPCCFVTVGCWLISPKQRPTVQRSYSTAAGGRPNVPPRTTLAPPLSCTQVQPTAR